MEMLIKLLIINQRYARVSINEKALSKEIHRKVKTKNFLGQDNLLAHIINSKLELQNYLKKITGNKR